MSITLRSAASLLRSAFDRRAQQRIEPTFVVTPRTAFEPASGVDMQKILAATRGRSVDLRPIEWNGDERAPARPVGDTIAEPNPGEANCRRIRDRYVAARFPGVAKCAADLEDADRVIKAARLYFGDGAVDTALELLDLAIAQDSRAEALWLAELEILHLARDASRFVECARAFRAVHATSDAWPEVARLGRALAPEHPLFGSATAPRAHEHYGPWPHLPNWIRADWDLTAEVLASDFHRAMTIGHS